MTAIDRDEIARLTEEYGGLWALKHAQRLLKLISVISAGQEYNADAVWLAAHMHDWGGYPNWAQPGVHHALRSRQVAEAFLCARGCEQGLLALVLECIEFHESGDPDRSIESILLSDADALDFLGVVGVLRDFSKNPRDLRGAYQAARGRKEKMSKRILLAKSRVIAAQRMQRMEHVLSAFEEDTFGLF